MKPIDYTRHYRTRCAATSRFRWRQKPHAWRPIPFSSYEMCENCGAVTVMNSIRVAA